MCNDSVTPINLPNTNAVRKFQRARENITEFLGQATITDFHEVKVIFVGQDVNNNSKYTSLLGGFTVVVVAFEIWII